MRATSQGKMSYNGALVPNYGNGSMPQSADQQPAQRPRKRRFDADDASGTVAAPGFSQPSSMSSGTPPDVLRQDIAKLEAQMHGLQQNMAMSEAQKQPAINALQQILSQKRQELMLVAPPADLPPVAASNPALAAALASIASGLKAGTAVAASGAQSANMNRVYVGSLHYDINEADIRMVFGQFGRIKQVDMSHEPSTGKSKGYCFVTYEQLEAADAAIAGMNGFQLAGRPIKVSRPASGAGGMGGGGGGGMPSSMAMPTASSSTSMAASASSNNPALVSYGEHMLAAAAPTVTGAGGSVDATVAAAQAAAAAAARAASMKPAFRVYVGCIPYELNAEHVRAIFGPFGLIRSVTLLPSQDPVMNPGQHRGYGFIEFEDEGAGRAAIEAMSGFEIAGRKLKVNQATSLNAPGTAVTAANPALASILSGLGAGAGLPLMPAPAQPSVDLAAIAQQAAASVLGQQAGAGAGYAPIPAASAGTLASGARQVDNRPAWMTQAASAPSSAPSDGYAAPAASASAAPSQQEAPSGSAGDRLIAIRGMVTPDEAADAELPAEIEEEATKYGQVTNINIVPHDGIVTVFIAFASHEQAQAGVRGMDKRYFGGRTTQAMIYPEQAYAQGQFNLG